jgi:hypothetical protein
MRLPKTLCLAPLALLLAACASNGPPPGAVQRLSPQDLARLQPPANPKIPLDEIVAWSKEGATPEAIVRRLGETGTVHILSPAQIVDLARQGVHQKVIDYLVDVQEKARQATLITQLADRDAQAAAQLAHERERQRALQQYYGSWQWGYGAGPWGPGYGIGRGYYYDPYFRGWRPRW